MITEVETAVLPEFRLASVTHIGPYHEIAQAFGRLAQAAGPLGLYRSHDPRPYQVGIYLDNPDRVPATELRSIAGVYVSEDADIGTLDETRQPAGKYLRATYAGDYATLRSGWEALHGQIIPSGGYVLREAPRFEVYVSPNHAAPPEDLRTHLYVPIL